MEDEQPDIGGFSDVKRDAIGEICDLMTASLVRALGGKLDSVTSPSPKIEIVELSEIASIIPAPALLVQLNRILGPEERFFIFIGDEDLPKIFEAAIPDDAKEIGADDRTMLEELKEMVNDAVYEVMVNLADGMGHSVSRPVIDTVTLQDESDLKSMSFLYPERKLLYIPAELNLPGGRINMGYLLPAGLGNQIIKLLLSEPPTIESKVFGDEEGMEVARRDQETLLAPHEEACAFEAGRAPQSYQVQSAGFDLLDERASEGGTSNISLLLDIALDASIELGKTQMTIEEVLKLGRGSVIEFDKLASEPVDFLVNGTVIARGEVVVIDDNFGIRITEISSPKDRLEHI